MKNDGFKKIKSLFYIVAIISMIIAIFGKVHAESMPDNEYNYIIDKIDGADNFSSVSTYMANYVKPYFPFFVEYVSSNYIFYKFVPTVNSCIGTNANSFSTDGQNWYSSMLNFDTYSFKGNTDRRLFYSLKGNISVNSLPAEPTHSGKRILAVYLCFDILNNSLSMGCYCEDNGYVVGNNNQTVNVRSYENTNNILESNVYVGYVSNSSSNYWFSWVNSSVGSTVFKPFRSSGSWVEYYTFDTMITNYTGYCMFASSIPLSGCLKFYRNLDDYIVSVDDNFIIYKSYGVGGISDPLLNIQYVDNIFSAGYTYTSSTTYSLTFDVDGTETTVSISSSAYPDDFFENGSFRTSFDLIYRMLSNKIMNFSSADTVTLTAVSMSATAYPTSNQQGTPETVSKSTLCNLVLKGSEGGEDIESDTIPAVSDVTIVYDQVSNSGDFYNHSGTWHNDVTIPDWAECYTIVIHGNYFPSGFNLGFSYDWLVDHQTFSKFQFKGYVDPTYINIQNAQVDYYDDLEFHKTDIIECIKFLGLLNSCDVVRIIVGDTDITGTQWTTVQDNIFFMSSYYQKLSIKGLGNIQSAVESGTYYTKALYWYTKDRLDNMSGYLSDYTKKSLSNQTVQNGYLQSINTNIISIKDSIDSGVNSIVSAIGGISSGGSSYSLPSLSTELQRLFIPSLTWESIDFDEYMDSLGVLKIPFEMTNDVLDVTKASYSPTLDLHINDFEIDVTGNNDKLTVFEDQDYSFNPRSIFNNQAWTMLTYLNAFAVILAEAWFTYCHIFRREKADDR